MCLGWVLKFCWLWLSAYLYVCLPAFEIVRFSEATINIHVNAVFKMRKDIWSQLLKATESEVIVFWRMSMLQNFCNFPEMWWRPGYSIPKVFLTCSWRWWRVNFLPLLEFIFNPLWQRSLNHSTSHRADSWCLNCLLSSSLPVDTSIKPKFIVLFLIYYNQDMQCEHISRLFKVLVVFIFHYNSCHILKFEE